MATATKGTKRPLLSAQEKVDAIRRVHDGESKASVARDIGVPESTLRGWCKNEDKILYLSRQSTPETGDSEPEVKKAKYLNQSDTGLNLSITSTTTESVPSMTNTTINNEISTPAIYEKGLNLTTNKSCEKKESSSTSNKQQMSERERNRAELNRLSAELGLNRPEFGLLNLATTKQQDITGGVNMSMLAASPLTAASSNISHMSGGITSQNNLGVSFNEIAAKVWQQVNQNAAVTATVKTTSRKSEPSNASSAASLPGLNFSHLNNKKTEQKTATDDPLLYWLKAQQEMLGFAQNAQYLAQMGQNVDSNIKNSSWFWKWYKQYYGFLPGATTGADATQIQNNILLQQLTKDAKQLPKDIKPITNDVKSASENKEPSRKSDKITKSPTKVRAVLDDLLANNNNVMGSDKSDKKQQINGYDDYDPPSSPTEALEHGQKFLRWLECCSDPSVTALQILQFRYLLNNVKACADRKNNMKNGSADKINRRK